MRADLGVGDDPVDLVARELRRQIELLLRQPDDDDRRTLLFVIRAFRKGGVEGLLLDVRRPQRPAFLVDEPAPAPPRRGEELLDPEERSEGERRCDNGEPQRAARAEQAELEQAASRNRVDALVDELLDDFLLGHVFRRRVLAGELLLRHELLSRHDQRSGEREQ